MSRDKGSRRLVKFWWVIAATAGAVCGAAASEAAPLSAVFLGIAMVGLPIAVVVGVLEWGGGGGPSAKRPKWQETRSRGAPAASGSHDRKRSPRRGQLHAISRRDPVEPPSSGGAGGN